MWVFVRTEVLVTLTTDVGKLLSKLNQVRPKGNVNFVSAIRIAHVGDMSDFRVNSSLWIFSRCVVPLLTAEQSATAVAFE